MSEETKIEYKTETAKLKEAQELQSLGMPAKVAAKLAGVAQSKVPRRL